MQNGLMSASNRKGITVRFEDSEMELLEELAKRYHVSSATIIRWSLKALSEYVEINGGRLTLPLDFSTIYQKAKDYSINSVEPLTPLSDSSMGNGSSGFSHANGAKGKRKKA